jgi:hypothetical protein
VAHWLYLPKEWAQDSGRRRKADVPAEVKFATKTEMALTPLETLLGRSSGRARASLSLCDVRLV